MGTMAALAKIGTKVGSAAKVGVDEMSKSANKQQSSTSDKEDTDKNNSSNIGRKIGTKVRGVTKKYLGGKGNKKSGGPVKVPSDKIGI